MANCLRIVRDFRGIGTQPRGERVEHFFTGEPQAFMVDINIFCGERDHQAFDLRVTRFTRKGKL